MYIWTILAVIALILLAMYWNSRNAVWGGLTLGIIIGVLWKIFSAFTGSGLDWYIVVKVAIIGTLFGFTLELSRMIGSSKRKTEKNLPPKRR